MAYMLAKLHCRYGKVQQLEEIMTHLVPVLESRGWRLAGAWVNSIGRLNTVHDLWELPDANSVRSVLALAAQDPEFRQWAAGLGECLEEETLELMEELGYSKAAQARQRV